MSNIINLSPPIVALPRFIPAPGEIDHTANHFLTALQSRGRSKNTVAAYECDLGQFIGFCFERGITYVQHVTTDVVERFFDALIQGLNVKPVTAARKRETLRSFFVFCVGRGLVQKNPVDNTLPFNVVTQSKIAPTCESLLRAIEQLPTSTTIGLRDRAYLRLLFDAALRASEPCRLDLFDADKPPLNTVMPQGIVVFTNKGGATQSNPIDEITLAYLADWLAVRGRWGRAGEPAMFITRSGHRITRTGMHARCKQIGNQVGMPHLHLHLFRHSRAGDIIETLGLRDGSEFLHHKNINTTQQIYGHYGEAHRHHRIRTNCPLGVGITKATT